MANSNGNIYSFLIIDNNQEVFGIDAQQNKHSLSKQDFAFEITVSEDGTIWALTTEADPDGGGLKLFWSSGNGNWTEFKTPDPGGVRISGGPGSSCYFVTSEGKVLHGDTDGSSSVFENAKFIYQFNYGGGYVWALLSSEEGGMPTLHYSPASNLSWVAFAGGHQPNSVSVDYNGDGFGIEDFSPVYYSKDGTSSNSAGAGADGTSLEITCKNWNYVLGTDANEEGNLALVWVDEQGGVFKPTSIRAQKVAATYYQAS